MGLACSKHYITLAVIVITITIIIWSWVLIGPCWFLPSGTLDPGLSVFQLILFQNVLPTLETWCWFPYQSETGTSPRSLGTFYLLGGVLGPLASAWAPTKSSPPTSSRGLPLRNGSHFAQSEDASSKVRAQGKGVKFCSSVWRQTDSAIHFYDPKLEEDWMQPTSPSPALPTPQTHLPRELLLAHHLQTPRWELLSSSLHWSASSRLWF